MDGEAGGLLTSVSAIKYPAMSPKRAYASMRRYRNLVNYYTNRNIAVSILRARKKNDLDRVLALYGSETSKYW